MTKSGRSRWQNCLRRYSRSVLQGILPTLSLRHLPLQNRPLKLPFPKRSRQMPLLKRNQQTTLPLLKKSQTTQRP